jgi:type IV pilus assembly protein PilE
MAGVTLIELMTVVIVIGVLSTVAVPMYRQYSIRAQRTDAKAALLRMQANQERFYLQNRTYGSDLTVLGFTGAKSEKGFYSIAVAGADAITYTATATAIAGGQLDDAECQTFSITAQGVRTATPDPQQRCW